MNRYKKRVYDDDAKREIKKLMVEFAPIKTTIFITIIPFKLLIILTVLILGKIVLKGFNCNQLH